ncbi:MAG: bifunctional 4-hydroxy-3-methylbut-2-enyl diphosphate reductase/30S ribosomal protein S1 [Christensenellales bacterium]
MIILAKNAGFCFGVKRAVEAVENNLDKKIVTLGHLIHNEYVVRSFEERGVKCVQSLDEVSADETIVIRSHGVSPQVLEEIKRRGIRYIDATCPFVKRIHARVAEAKAAGLPVIIVGKKGHPEVDGTIGWSGENAFAIYSDEEIKKLPHLKKAVVVAQTTITEDKWNSVLFALRSKVDNIIPFLSICSATKERQNEAKEIAQKSDTVIVVGGKSSSNTQKLYELCKRYCKNVYYIEHYKELLLEKMLFGDIISIVAGASTPDTMIREVFNYMIENEKVLPPSDAAVTDRDAATDSAEQNTQTAELTINESLEAIKETKSENAEEEKPVPSTEKDEFLEGLEKVIRLKKGQIVRGNIVQITDEDICVNIGYKSDGIIHKDEISLEEINPKDVFGIGQEIEAEVINVNDGEGNVILSRKRIEKKQNWLKMKENVGSEKLYKCTVKKAVKGGVTTKIDGYSTFIPASHLALKYIEDLKQFEGKEIEVTLIDADKRQERLVASHKNVLIKNKREKEEQLWNSFVKGSRVKGVVKRLTDFGAFVDIGGVDGLLHISDISWSRVKHPSDVISEGQELELIIINIDVAKKKIALGYKQLQPKPWDLVPEKYHEGDIIKGKVVRIVPFGAFVQIEPTVDGLIHISQVSRHRLERVEDELRVGDEIDVKILEVNADKRKISLSRKALLAAEEPRIEKKDIPENDENFNYELPPIQESTVSLADFFPKKDE